MINTFDTSNKVKRSSILKMAFVFTLLVIPQVLFIIILYLNNSFDIYKNNYETLQNYFINLSLPTYNLIMISAWFGTSIYIISIIFILFLDKLLNKTKLNKMKHTVIVGLGSLIIMSFLITSVSEYNYSKFFQMYSYVSNSNIDNANPVLENVIEKLKNNYNEKTIYGWATDTMTWWLCLVKVTITIIYFSFFSNSLEKKKLNTSHIKKVFGQEKFSTILSSLSLNSKKNISLWIILSALAVFIPHFIYVITISIHNNSLNSMLNWTFSGLELINKSDLSQNYSQFAIKNLPIITSGFMIATICVLGVIYFKKEEINYKFLITQFIILFIEVIFLISVNTYSMHKLNEIYNYWNENNLSHFINTNEYLYKKLGSSFINSDGTIKDFFLYGIKYVSHAIITFSLFITSYVIIGTKLIKNYKISFVSTKIDNI
ncbi:hypothetical protein [Spiroplasma turonicum]|uniref:Transmembrane protein n=1 Tax=Spiroplasma turonicum TaxID=216946 RepID=A0A0K1P7L5_9MOLU|nr:hypothetical protein [Spiroplasma turonicum]AKU80288.1 hypothetical protein STURON_001042 [Spiroplasma turonicum]ALX71289.1 hypothetical protein STURO_v1c10380 [Spiroplasma turonicum]